PNIRVVEEDQVDTLTVYNGGSPSNDVGGLTADRLSGLGMGGDAVIGGRLVRGGIGYTGLEAVNIELGSGDDTFTIESTHAGSTTLASADGSDTVNVKTLLGHTTIGTGLGNDIINVGSDLALLDQITALLTVDGGAGTDVLNITDTGDSNDNLGVLTRITLTGLDMPTVSEVQTLYVQAAGGQYRLRLEGAGSSFTIAPTPPVGGQAVADATLPTVITVGLSGEAVADEIWSVTLVTAAGSSVHTHTVAAGEDLADVAAALANDINTHAAGFLASVVGETIAIVNLSGRFAVLADSPDSGVALVDDSTARLSTVTLQGAVAEDDEWQLTLTSGGTRTTYSCTVLAGQSLADVAQALAAQVNTRQGFTTITVGSVLVIVNLDGALAVSAVGPVAGQAWVDGSVPGAATVTLSGEAVVGATWSLTLNNGLATSTHSHVVAAGETLADVAAALAGDINAGAAEGFAATVWNGLLVVANVTGKFVASAVAPSGGLMLVDDNTLTLSELALAGTAVEGQVWLVALDDGHSISTHSYAVAAGDTLASVAAGLAAAINADAGRGFVAFAVGETLAVSRVTVATLDYRLSPAAVGEQLARLYGILPAELAVEETARLAGSVTYKITFIREQAGINWPQLEWAESADGVALPVSGLTAGENASVDVRTATLMDGTTTPTPSTIHTLCVEAVGGTFAIRLLGQTTGALPYDATAEQVRMALEPILNPNNSDPSKPYTDNFTVTKHGNVFHIAFQGEYRGLRLTQADIDSGALDGFAVLQTRLDGINYYNVETTNIGLGSGNDRLDVWSIVNPTNIRTGDGADVTNIGNPASTVNEMAAPLFIDAQGHTPLHALLLLGTLDAHGASDGDVLNVTDDHDDVPGANTGLLTRNTIDGLGLYANPGEHGITYENFDVLNITLGDGGHLFDILSTHGGLTHVITGDGDDVVNVGTEAQTGRGTLDEIDGRLILHTGAGADQLNLFDIDDTNPNTGLLAADAGRDVEHSLTGLDMPAGGLWYDGAEEMNLYLGVDSDQLTLSGPHAETYTNIYGNTGDDRFIFLDDSCFRGTLSGQAGLDTIDYTDYRLNAVTGFKANTFYITAPQEGHIAGRFSDDPSAIDFSSVEHILGGENRDQFVFFPNG
ncbi:MAG: hypothetical protein NTU94_04405, partial [Planctomycetota bacterium]|nr:hypothetical protein [Planctomycetota bacterium]